MLLAMGQGRPPLPAKQFIRPIAIAQVSDFRTTKENFTGSKVQPANFLWVLPLFSPVSMEIERIHGEL